MLHLKHPLEIWRIQNILQNHNEHIINIFCIINEYSYISSIQMIPSCSYQSINFNIISCLYITTKNSLISDDGHFYLINTNIDKFILNIINIKQKTIHNTTLGIGIIDYNAKSLQLPESIDELPF